MLITNKLTRSTFLILFVTVIFQLLVIGVVFADTTLYDFESGTQNWTHQTYTDSQACTSVTQSSTQSYEGTYSLRMNMNLIGGDTNNSKGESYVDVGEGTEIDLDGVPFNVWVYCPTGSDGNSSNPNGMQIFFKDSSWRSWYGPWNSIGDSLTWYDILMDTWTELGVTLGTTTPAYVDSGFDATNIRMIGIKMATGTGSTATYPGPVYVDYVYTEGGDTTPPSPPTGVSVSDPGIGGRLNISWTNPTDPDFSHINIYRSTVSGSLGSLIVNNATSTSYQDSGLTNNVIYYYTLRSMDVSSNESTNTDQYSGMPTGASTTHVFYDFEDGTIEGWMLDAATGLVNTTTRAQNGTHSVKFNVATSGSLLGLGGQGYVTAYSYEGPYPGKDMEDYDGFSVWIYLEPGITITDYINAIPVLYTYPSGFYRGDSTQLHLTSSNLGMWHKLTFDIALDGPISVQHVSRMGVWLEGGGVSGNADLYVDFMEGVGFHGDITPPGPPTNVIVSDPGTGGTLNLGWTNPTDADFNFVKIYRSTTSGNIGSLIDDLVFGTSFQDTGLANGTVYYYTIHSVDFSQNESTNTDQHSGTPTAPDTTPPSPPTDIVVSNPGTGGTLNLYWTNPGDSDFDHIHIYRSTSSGVLGPLVHDNVTGTNLADTGLTNGETYYYTLRSVDTSDNESTNTDQHSGTPTGTGAVSLYDFEDGATGGWVNDTSGDFVDNLGASSNTTAQAQEGLRSLSYPLNLNVKDPTWNCINDAGYIDPSPPKNLTGSEGIVLYMYIPDTADISPSTPACSSVYVKTGSSWNWFESEDMVNLTLGVWTQITLDPLSAKNASGQTGQTVTDLNDVKEIGFHLSGAATASGNTNLYVDNVYSIGGTGPTPPSPPTNIVVSNPGTGGTLNLSWTNPGDPDFDHIHIYRSTVSGQLGSLVHDNVTGINLADTGLTNGEIYYYTLRSVNTSDVESTNTDQHSGTPTFQDTTPPAPPTDIYVVDAQIGEQLNISWMNPTDGDFSHIHIYRSTTSGVLGSLVYDDIVGTSLADAGLTNGQTYYYTLRSVDTSSNESTNTDQHSGTPSLVTITALFDFEDGTTGGWINDTSVYFCDNLGTPYNTTSRHNTGTHSLAFPLNFDDKDPTWGTINDTAYVIPASSYDLSTRTGISVYIYVAHTGFQYDAPPCGTVYVKTGSDWDWFESEDYVNIPWSFDCGNFRRITINFSSAKNAIGDIVPVTNLNDVKEIGIHISGASTGSGSSTLYLDTVRLNGGTGDTTPPSPPTSITVTDTQMGGELYLTWINPPDADFDHVNIYRSQVSGQLGEWIRQCANNVNSYLDTGLINGTQYYYTLRSVDTSMNESTNTDQHSGVPTIASVLLLYDFEDGTTQGWVNDTSGDFVNNLGVPANSTVQAQEGTHSLAYALNLDVKDPVWSCINDAGYVRPSPPKNLSTANGIVLYMYIPDTADISPSTPACSSVYVKTGSGWSWFESDEMVNLTLGVWNRITINFISAKNASGQTGQAVTDLDNIQEIGIHISGAATSSGSTFLYIDNVVAIGAEPETELSVSITGSYNFGTLELGEEVISTQALTVTNSGNITETFSLSLVDPSGWAAVQTDPGSETYVLNGMFNSSQPVALSFVENNHALSLIPQQCSLTKFAGDQTGTGVSSSDTRSLWFEFRAPTITTISTPQTIRLIATAEAT